MKLTRCPRAEAEDKDPCDWEVVVDVPLVKPEGGSWTKGLCVSWERANWDPTDTGRLEVYVDGHSADDGPAHSYILTLPAREFGAMLGLMPEDAAAAAVQELLRSASPRVLGAIVGGILAQVTAAAMTPAGG